MATVADLVDELERIAPPELAEDGDRIGLQVGSPASEVRRVCVAVDVTDRVIEQALARNAGLIVSHHALIYAPLTSVAEGTPVTDRIARLIRANAAVFVMHTNYDVADGGVNDVLADKLGVKECCVLEPRKREKLYKVAVFVPEEAIEKVRGAMANSGAGVIGQYSHCSFRTRGTGSFLPSESARPHVGSSGKLEEVDEFRLEMICSGSQLDAVVASMTDAHPYEEVAYDVYELANPPITRGYGRVGTLDAAMSLADFAERVRRELDVRYLRVFGDSDKRVSRVALLGGGGSSDYKLAAASGADVYVTGDMSHHDILDANALGLAIIDAGHFETERPGMLALVERLRDAFPGASLDVDYVE